MAHLEDFFVQLGQYLIYGLSLGAVYALIALGYTMVYGIIKLINFAHGDIYMVGAYLGFFGVTIFRPLDPGGRWFWFAALVMAMLGCALAGMLIERVAYKPLRQAPRITALITAIGVSLLLEYGMMLWQSPQQKYYGQLPPALTDNTYFLFDVFMVQKQHLIFFAVAVLLMVGLYLVVQYTKIGKAMRAVSYDKEAALLMGIDVDKTISFTFALGSLLAAAAGVLFGSFYPIEPLMGVMPGLKAFVAAVLGGIGIIPGAMLGGLLMGVAEAIVVGFFSSTLRDVVAFAVLILILLIKPTGLLGAPSGEKV
ncbi:MAG: branched-chain amino acid ABC transporter permease [Firmicutes bacterium]|nr:branched-chain amino acid ABC transporter permease [Bacillota bacterium]